MPNIVQLWRIWRNRQLRLGTAPTRGRRSQASHAVDAVAIAAVCGRSQGRPEPRQRGDAAGLIQRFFGQLLVQGDVGLIVDRGRGGGRRERAAGRRPSVAAVARGVGGIGSGLLGLEAGLGAPAERLYGQQAGCHGGCLWDSSRAAASGGDGRINENEFGCRRNWPRGFPCLHQ